MKKRLQVTTAALAATALMFLIGFLILPDTSNKPKPVVPIENAAQVYADALPAVVSAQDITLNISKTQEMTIGSEVFVETSEQHLACTGIGTNDFRASAAESLSIDSYNVSFTEAFSNNTGYVSINDSCFSGTITAEEYLKRFAPAILMDHTIYGSVTGVDNGDQYMITFAQPYSAETWALSGNAAFVNAEGTAYINYDGQLTKSIYNLTYKLGKSQFQMTYAVDVVLSCDEITLPDTNTTCIPINYLDGPRMLERASGYLLQANNVSAHYNDDIYFQAFGDARTQDITLHMTKNENWSAFVQTLTTLKNDSRVGQDSQLKKAELFTGNTYQASVDDQAPVVNNDITADEMYNYCQNILVGTVMLPEHITGAQLVETEQSIRIQYSASDEFAILISSNACHSLYQEPELLNDLAQSRTTDKLECYLELDRITGLPIASGISYSGAHNIEGLPYSLSYHADQIYNILSQNAQEEINKAAE